jgi:hypothetical protein
VPLEAPRPIVEEGNDLDVEGNRTHAISSPPSSLELGSARQEFGPAFAEEVDNEDDKGASDRNQGRFEL